MQITKAMELVASSKLRKAKERAEVCRPYFTELHETLKEIARENTDFSSVYAKESSNNKTCYVVIAGDRGLAGGYNANLFKCLEASAEGKDYMVLPVGKKAVEYFRQREIEALTEQFAEVGSISVADCFEMANMLCTEFRKGTFGHIELSTIRSPGATAAIALATLFVLYFFRSSPLIVTAEPVNPSFFLLNIPVTTTSSSALVSDFITTDI